MNGQDINKALIDTLKSPELNDLTVNLGEVALDQIMSEGILKDLPIFGSLQKLYKMGLSIRDALFLKKLCNFLFSMSAVSNEDRIRLLEKMKSDAKSKYEVGEKILMLLERADDFLKPIIIAETFKAYMRDKINYDQLQRISYGIDHLYIRDLKDFKKSYINASSILEESAKQNLRLCGFVILSMRMDGRHEVEEITNLGELLLHEVLEKIDNL